MVTAAPTHGLSYFITPSLRPVQGMSRADRDDVIAQWINALGSLVRSVSGIAANIFKVPALISSGISATQLTAGFSISVDNDQLKKGLVKLFVFKNGEKRFDAALDVVKDSSQLFDGISTFAPGLAAIGLATEEGIAWSAQASFISAALSSVILFINAKGIYHARKILQKLENKEDLSSEKYHLKSLIGLSGDNLRSINKIQDAGKKEEIYSLLKERVSAKITSNKIGMLITLVAVVASSILYFASQAALVTAGLALLVSVAVVTMKKLQFETDWNAYYNQKISNLI